MDTFIRLSVRSIFAVVAGFAAVALACFLLGGATLLLTGLAITAIVLIPALIIGRIIVAYGNRHATPQDVRTLDGALQTATLIYEHPLTRRRVVLVGMSHVGTAEYYAATKAEIAALEELGYAVVYEHVDPKGTTDAKLSEAQLRLAMAIKIFKGTRTKIGSDDGLALQREAMPPAPSWRNVDMTMGTFLAALERARLAPPRWLLAILALIGKRAKDCDCTGCGLARRVRTEQALLSVGRPYHLGRLLGSALPPVRRLMGVVLDERNATALTGIKRLMRANDVVSIWGAGHSPGIGRGLEAEGYRLKDVAWRTVARPEPRSSKELRLEVLRLRAEDPRHEADGDDAEGEA